MSALGVYFLRYHTLCNVARTTSVNLSRQYRPIQITKVSRVPFSNSAAPATPSADSAPSSPTFLIHLRNELKTALRAKDTGRLPVIRALLADVTNASKTAQPIATDKQLKKRILKRATACRRAAEEYQRAGRSDLVKDAENEIRILEQYAAQIEVSVPSRSTHERTTA